MKPKLRPTGHAEIDRQHVILDKLVGHFHSHCSQGDEQACEQCSTEETRRCVHSLVTLADSMLAVLAGHANYEEKLMQLLPDLPNCQLHTRRHKEAHAEITHQLLNLTARIDEEDPIELSRLMHDLLAHWLGDHVARYDEPLVAHVADLMPTEIEFDNELVSILDKYVFHDRPTALPAPLHGSETRQEIEARLALLTPRQQEVCALVVQGLANKRIAKALGTTVNTVKTHRAEIYRKLQVSSLLELLQLVEFVDA